MTVRHSFAGGDSFMRGIPLQRALVTHNNQFVIPVQAVILKNTPARGLCRGCDRGHPATRRPEGYPMSITSGIPVKIIDPLEKRPYDVVKHTEAGKMHLRRYPERI